MKELIRPDKGYLLVSLDLSQAENRVVAYSANEQNMIRAFEQGMDIHRHTASLIYSVHIDEVNPEQRQGGKTANHALNYDMTARRYAVEYQVSLSEATYIVERYHQIYPGIRNWHRQIKEELQKSFSLTNMFGRTIEFIGPTSGAGAYETFKMAYSFRPQSTVADITNRWGIVEFYKDRHSAYEPGILLNNIHDQILFEWPINLISELPRAIDSLKASMERPLQGTCKEFSIPVNINLGMNLKDCVEIESLEWEVLDRTDKERICKSAAA